MIKKTEIININIENNNKEDENNTLELSDTKSCILKKSELAQKRFLAKVEQAKRTIENLKPSQIISSTSENDLNVKTTKYIEEKENENEKSEENTKKDEEIKNKKKYERRSYYYYADTGSDDEKEEEKKDNTFKFGP